jgi:hypothetical protein
MHEPWLRDVRRGHKNECIQGQQYFSAWLVAQTSSDLLIISTVANGTADHPSPSLRRNVRLSTSSDTLLDSTVLFSLESPIVIHITLVVALCPLPVTTIDISPPTHYLYYAPLRGSAARYRDDSSSYC